jgi:hypothetical protein
MVAHTSNAGTSGGGEASLVLQNETLPQKNKKNKYNRGALSPFFFFF